MKSFNKIFALGLAIIAALSVWLNVSIAFDNKSNNKSRLYRVEISRAALKIEEKGFGSINISDYEYIDNVVEYDGDPSFYSSNSDNLIQEINGRLYRFDYRNEAVKSDDVQKKIIIFSLIITVLFAALMIYINKKLLHPFSKLKDLPYELSKGNLTAPIPETKGKFFGKFTWGLDLLRENIEERRKKELELQKEKKTLLLSLSHDIKTPLSAIKLYAKALEKGLYTEKEKQKEIAANINEKASEIEKYVSHIINASREDFLSIEVNTGEAYLSELINNISAYYQQKIELNKTRFTIGEYENIILKCDLDRSVEVLQNLIENALKYGDGKEISIDFSNEEDCQLISVSNTGSSLPTEDLPHIFESFWRGSNAHDIQGSGLGLYICRQIMTKMNGDLFAETEGDRMIVTAVFTMA